MATLEGPPRKAAGEAGGDAAVNLTELEGDAAEPEMKLPRCNNDHPFQAKEESDCYCCFCYNYAHSPSAHPYFCGFCRDGCCQSCYDKKLKKLNPDNDGDGEKKSKTKKKKKRRGSEASEDSDEEDEDDEEDDGDKEDDEDEENEDKVDAAVAAYEAKAKKAGLSDEDIELAVSKAMEEAESKAGDKAGDEEAMVELAAAAMAELTAKLPQKFDLAALVPPEPEVEPAALFGRGSRVTMVLDTDAEGGTLAFEVDGQRLRNPKDGATELTNIFAMLGSNQLYPCLNLCPLDEQPPTPESEPPEADKAAAGGDKAKAGEGKKKGKKEDEEAEKKREAKRIEMNEVGGWTQLCSRVLA